MDDLKSEPPLPSTHRESLRSAGVIGGSTVLSLVIGIARTKVVAVVLGPSGVGLFSLYLSSTGLFQTIAGMGIATSGVRQIAAARGLGDERLVAVTAATVRLVTVCLGAMGALSLFLLRYPVSRQVFGSDHQAWAIGLLSTTVMMGCAGAGLGALIQGSRRIGDMARQQVIGAAFSVLVTIPLVLWLGEFGVAWSMVAASAAALGTTWWFARRVPLPPVQPTWSELSGEARALLSLGAMFMASGLLGAFVGVAVASLIARELGVLEMGLYAASARLSALYVDMVLNAMGADYFPRLTAVVHDQPRCNQTINEQAEVSLLLAAPGVIATLAAAPLLIGLFYSSEFTPAVDILRWQILGVLGRVVTWPVAYVFPARGAKKLFISLEIFAAIVHVSLIWLGMRTFGLIGVGMAFFLLYIAYAAPVLILANRLTGFRWSASYLRHFTVLLPVVAVVFLSTRFLPEPWVLAVGAAALAFSGYYSLSNLHNLVGSPTAGAVAAKVLRMVPFMNRRRGS